MEPEQPPMGMDTQGPPAPPPEDPGPPPPPWLQYASGDKLEDQNLVPQLEASPEGKEWLEKLANRVVTDLKDDQQGASGYLERLKGALDLYFGRESKFSTGPASGERKPCLPTLAKIVNRIYARTMGVVLSTEPVAVPTGDEDNDRAVRVGQHISWEKRMKHPEWKPAMQASVLQWILNGSMFRWMTWDPLEDKKCIEWLSAEELVLPYSEKDPDPRLSNVSHYTRIMKMPKHKLLRLGKCSHYAGIAELFAKDAEKRPTPYNPATADRKLSKASDELFGLKDDKLKRKDVFTLLERHGWEVLPLDTEEIPRRIAITIEESTKRPLRLVIMEEEVKIDLVRYANETKLKEFQAQNSGQPFDPSTVTPPRTQPIFPAVHYVFSPNPEGIYGLGAWVFVGRLNELANELAGEDLVGQRLANVSNSTGFISSDINLEKGAFKLEYGTFKPVDIPQGGLAGSIMPMPFDRPRGNILGWIDKIDGEAQAVMSSSDTQSGMPGPSHETAAAAKIRAYQGMTSITSAIEAFLVALSIEYQNYARLNAAFLSGIEYFYVVQPDPDNPGVKKKVRMEIQASDYQADFDITFDADARLEVDPGIGQSAIDAYHMIIADPDLQGDMNLRMAARKKALKALKANDLAAMLPDEVPPPPPPEPKPQEEENSEMMQEQDTPVLPDDDHEDHLKKINEFKGSGQYHEMSSTGRQLMDRHERGHKAQAYLLATQLNQKGREMDAEDQMKAMMKGKGTMGVEGDEPLG